MSSVSDIVSVVITRLTKAVSQAGFGTLLVFGPHVKTRERVSSYASIEEVLDAGFGPTDPFYIAANAAFSQPIPPARVKFGRQQVDEVNILFPTGDLADLGDVITFQLDDTFEVGDFYGFNYFAGLPYHYEVQTGDSLNDVVDGFVLAINAGADPIVAANAGNGKITVTHNVADTFFGFSLFRAASIGPVVYEGTTGMSIVGSFPWIHVDQKQLFVTNTEASTVSTDLTLAFTSAINAAIGTEFTAVDNDPAVTLTVDVTGTAFLVSAGDFGGTDIVSFPTVASGRPGINLLTAVAAESGANVAVALAAISDEDDDWYEINTVNIGDETEVLAIAAYIETKKKIFGLVSDDADILDDTVTTDIASLLEALNRDRTFVLYSTVPELFPDSAWAGNQLPLEPGAASWALKTLSGVTADLLTSSQADNAFTKNANTYEAIGGVDITRFGTMASGEYVDIMRGVDWIHARMTERVYQQLVTLPKVPYTDAGVASITSVVLSLLNEAVTRGILSGFPSPSVSAPKVKDISTVNKANRLLPDVKFKATLAGAIHKVEIAGTVSL